MNFPFKNIYGKNTFFIAHVEKTNYIPDNDRVSMVEYDPSGALATSRIILRASEMAQDLTEASLLEHFSVDKKLVKHIDVVQVYYQKQITHNNETEELVYGKYTKQLFTLNEIDLVPEPATRDHVPVIMLQGLAYSSFFTEAFHAKDMRSALQEMDIICNSAIILNTLYTTIIHTIKLS